MVDQLRIKNYGPEPVCFRRAESTKALSRRKLSLQTDPRKEDTDKEFLEEIIIKAIWIMLMEGFGRSYAIGCARPLSLSCWFRVRSGPCSISLGVTIVFGMTVTGHSTKSGRFR